MAVAMFKIMVVKIINEPNKNAATKTMLISPKNGSVIMESKGFITDSNSKPKKLPNRAPNIHENTPAAQTMPARSIFLTLYKMPPPITKHKP